MKKNDHYIVLYVGIAIIVISIVLFARSNVHQFERVINLDDKEQLLSLARAHARNFFVFVEFLIAIVLAGGITFHKMLHKKLLYDMAVHTAESLTIVNRQLEAEIERRKHIEEALRTEKERAEVMQRMAEQASQAKSSFLANMSHEIRTPMNAIVGFSELMKTTTLSPTQEDYVQTISESSAILLSLIDDILDISKIESAHYEFESITFNFPYLLESLVRLLRHRIAEKNAAFEMTYMYEPTLPLWFQGDPTRIRQVILNLLSNAIKFTDEGEVALHVMTCKENTEGASDSCCRVLLSIRDTGIGIRAEKTETIFEAFTQADSSTTRKYGGTGLGLTIAKTLIEKMGGSIRVNSTVGKGSEFIVELPLVVSSPPEGTNERCAFSGLEHKRVCIVDAHQGSLEIIRAYCEEFHMNIVGTFSDVHTFGAWAEDGAASAEVIIVDDKTIEKDLAAFVRRLPQERFSSTKCIVLSAVLLFSGNGETERKELFQASLAKPVLKQELYEVLRTTLGGTEHVPSTDQRHGGGEGVLHGMHILIVDDNPINVKLMEVILQHYGCSIHHADNGKTAIQLVRERPFHMIIMDLQMPEMGGIEAVRLIRQECKATMPIVAVTAAAMEHDRYEALEVGMNDFITKPVDISELRTVLLKWLHP